MTLDYKKICYKCSLLKKPNRSCGEKVGMKSRTNRINMSAPYLFDHLMMTKEIS